MSDSRRRGSLGRGRRLALYVVAFGVWLSGALWLLFHYFLQRPGDFGPTANPLEPWWLKIHGAFAFAAVGMGGMLWAIHITVLWPGRRRRWSGGLLTAASLLLVLTGYLLYYVGDERARGWISTVHWVSGLLCPAWFIWHRWRRKQLPLASYSAPSSRPGEKDMSGLSSAGAPGELSSEAQQR